VSRRAWAFAAALALGFVAATAATAEVTLRNGWLRAAPAGAPSVDAYVDVRSDQPLRLVAASSPVAKRVELVAGSLRDGNYETRVVPSFDVPANQDLRFALRGNVLRLVDIRQAFGNADGVPLRLEFRDERNAEVTASVVLQVRGVLPPRPAAPDSVPPLKPAP
jgi:copper(I)-binding protein